VLSRASLTLQSPGDPLGFAVLLGGIRSAKLASTGDLGSIQQGSEVRLRRGVSSVDKGATYLGKGVRAFEKQISSRVEPGKLNFN
jgi:hypothetical protein